MGSRGKLLNGFRIIPSWKESCLVRLEVKGKKKKKGGQSRSPGSSIHADDTEAMEEHIRELQKEGKVNPDRD